MAAELKTYFSKKIATVERALRSFLPKDNALISRAMRYSIFAGGKRLRPVLVIMANDVCGGNEKEVLPAACALEFIHTYSLIHDDLPAMDDDDLRRGMPTSHRKFGEATAILAGDALLTDAFRLIALSPRRPERALKAQRILSEAAGYQGMIGGQMKDTVETGNWNAKSKNASKKNLHYIHLHKTAALIRASLLIGGELAGGSPRQLAALAAYGDKTGIAFQVADDILDIEGDKKLLGKRGSDRENNKLTYPALYGLEESKALARRLVEEAKQELSLFGGKAGLLRQLADFIIERHY